MTLTASMESLNRGRGASLRYRVRQGWAVVVAAIVGLSCALPARAAASSDGWLTSFDEARAAAEDTGRPILTVFTGSDWCVHCRTLEENVLHTDTFRAWARERVVLLMIDLPQNGISAEERRSRSRVCVKYGVRTFPSVLLLGPDGAKITAQSGYKGQSADAWVAAIAHHVPQAEGGSQAAVQKPADAKPGEKQPEQLVSSLDEAVATARDTKRPILVMVSRSSDGAAKTAVASLIEDPEFESLARENFVVASVPSGADQGDEARSGALEALLEGVDLPPEGVEIIVTDDGQTPIFVQSGQEPPHRVVSGLRRFLAGRQSTRR